MKKNQKFKKQPLQKLAFGPKTKFKNGFEKLPQKSRWQPWRKGHAGVKSPKNAITLPVVVLES